MGKARHGKVKVSLSRFKTTASRVLDRMIIGNASFDRAQQTLLPIKAHVNVTNVCNSNCVFCGYQYCEDPRERMSDAVFEDFVVQYAGLTEDTYLSLTPTVGDPLLDKSLFKKISIAKGHGIRKIETYTNAILLEKYTEAILNSGVDELYISFPDFNRKEYELIFRTKKYEQSVDGIEYFLSRHKKLASPIAVRINLRARRPLEAIFKEPDYKRAVEPFLSDKVVVDETVAFDNWCGLIQKHDLPRGMNLKEDGRLTSTLPCMDLFKLMFLQNGDVKLCGCRFNRTVQDELIIGNIHEKSLRDIWFSERAFDIRRNWMKGKYPDVCTGCCGSRPVTRALFQSMSRDLGRG